jgi:outer membrane protein assembly factor BamB
MQKRINVGMIGALALFAAGAGFAAGAETQAAPVSPYLAGAAWPVMRGDLQNTGRAHDLKWDAVSRPRSELRHFPTGNGIFSTPVLDDRDRIYAGSADHVFYVFDPATGREAWRYQAGELIDSAAALGRDGAVYVPAGDALHALAGNGREQWAWDLLKDRPADLYSFSTNYWWEGNVVIGPDGALYAGDDDFFFYCLEPDGRLRWAFRTGFLVWSAAAFDNQGAVYFAGFDMKLYALDRKTGKRKWKTDLGNALVASPALGDDGTIYQGSMGGKFFALDSRTGRVKWTIRTGGHIYASAAVAGDGNVYVASTDGLLYALAGESGAVRWTYDTGDAVRSSPALGPDPEGKAAYLIYFGGGEGAIYALDPAGRRRWSYDSLGRAGTVDYPNINASPALGRSGLALASADGDVIWVPYDYYLRPEAVGITREPGDGFPASGAAWYYVTPGGLIERTPLPDSRTASPPRAIQPAQVVSLRLLAREQGRTVSARLRPDSVRVQSTPALPLRIEFQSDGRTIQIVPEEFPAPGANYLWQVTGTYQSRGGQAKEAAAWLSLAAELSQTENPLLGGGRPGFEITQMAVPEPAIVPSLDQIGIASLTIPFAVVESDPAKHTFVAWAVQRHGETETGEQVGVPKERCLFYAFAGRAQGDAFVLEAPNSFFEETSFPFPLDGLRFSGRLRADGTAAPGASLLLEFQSRGILRALPTLTFSGVEEGSEKGYVQSSAQKAGWGPFLAAAKVTLPTVLGYLQRGVWNQWGMYNAARKFVGAGTFRLHALPPAKTAAPEGVQITRLAYEPARRRVVAEVQEASGPARRPAVVLGILLVDDTTGKPVAINYNLATSRERLADGGKRVTLTIPKSASIKPGQVHAYLMADLAPLQRLEL